MNTYIVVRNTKMYFVEKVGETWKILGDRRVQRDFGFEADWLVDGNFKPCGCHSAKVFRHKLGCFVMFYDDDLVVTDMSLADWRKQSEVSDVDEISYDDLVLIAALDSIDEVVAELSEDCGAVKYSDLLDLAVNKNRRLHRHFERFKKGLCEKRKDNLIESVQISDVALAIIQNKEMMSDSAWSEVLEF